MKIRNQTYRVRTFVFLQLIIVLFLGSCSQEIRRDENNSIIGEVLSSDRVKIDYRVNGPKSDTVVVFIHEWLCNQTYWQQQVLYFSTRCRIVTLDLAGHGRSGDNREQWTMDRYADDVMAVIKKVKAKKVYLVGHSMGASIAVKVALRMPGKVISIFAVDTFQNLTVDYPAENLEKFITPYRNDFTTTVQKHASVIFGDDPDAALVKRVIDDWGSADPDMAINSMIDYLNFKPSEWTQKIDIPVFALNSVKFPPNEEGNKRMLTHYKMIPMRGVGHFPQLEDPKTFNNMLWSLLLMAAPGDNSK